MCVKLTPGNTMDDSKPDDFATRITRIEKIIKQPK